MQKANPKLIGVFILAAFFIFIATFLLINRDRFFSRSIKYVLYFQGSIKGLNVGSPVVFNGVPIGRVIRISLVTDVQTLQIRIPVYIETNKNSFIVLNAGNRSSEKDIRIFTEKMIAKGLRAKLENQSLLTGQMMIGLSYYPDTPIILQGNNPKIIEIPTLPSTSEELLQTLQKLPLQKTLTNLNVLLSEADGLLKMINNDSPDVIKDVSLMMDALRDVAQKTRKALGSFDNVAHEVENTLEVFNNSMKSFDNSVKSFHEDSPTMLDLNKMLRDFSTAARSLQNLTDYLERHPESLLRGKGEN